MFKTGLVSVSFRKLSPEEIIREARGAGLAGIEWGGDVHVPAGDVKTAKLVGEMTRDAGLEVFAYGSYYRPGENSVEEFLPVLECAKALGAPSIRVWAGAKWSWRADEAYVQKVISDTQAICELAEKENIGVAYEYHIGTLTDNRFSATEVFREIGRTNIALYWQPNFCLSTEDNLLALQMVRPMLRDIHVFFWDCLGERKPLEEGEPLWNRFLQILRDDPKEHRLMLEFFRKNSVEQFRNDAKILNRLVLIDNEKTEETQ